MSNKNLYIKSNKNLVKKTFPRRIDGKNGDIRFVEAGSEGFFLTAKINENWYSTSQLRRFQERNITKFKIIEAEKIEVSGSIQDNKNGFNWIIDEDGDLNCDSITFNQSSTRSITSQAAEGNGQSTLISGQGTTSGSASNDGGNVYICGGSSPAGAQGVVSINHNKTTSQGSYLDIWSHTRLRETKKLYFDGAESTTGFLDVTPHTYIYESADDILDFVVGNVNMLKLDETNDKIQFTGGSIELLANADDYASFTVADTGDLTIATVGDGSTDSDLILDADGIIALDAASGSGIDFKIAGGVQARMSTQEFYFYNLLDSPNDYFKIDMSGDGNTTISTADSAGANAHLSIEPDGHVEFDGCGVGFDLVTPTFNAADTNVDFRTGNKQMVTLTDNLLDLNLTFPATSGNFTLLLKQDATGSRTMATDGWLAFESDGTAATVPAVKFPGGTEPTLTTAANHVDIVSFFWDADNQVCYGVASLDFQD